MVVPENLGQILQLEGAVQLAISTLASPDPRGRPFSLEALETQIRASKELAMHRRAQDPSEGPLTENVVIHGGNHVVYPGIGTGNTSALRALLRSIFLGRPPDELQGELYAPVRAMLLLSDAIAARMGHRRWSAGPEDEAATLAFPSSVRRGATAVSFVPDDLRALLAAGSADLADLAPFLIEPSAVGTTLDPDACPLSARPLLRIGGLYVVAQPTSIVTCLVRFVIQMVQQHGILGRVMRGHHQEARTRLLEAFDLMSLPPIAIDLPAWSPPIDTVSEVVFRLDTDKLCFLQFVTDNGADYDPGETGSWRPSGLSEALTARRDAVIRHLGALQTPEAKCLAVFALGGIGRDVALTCGKPPSNARVLAGSDDDIVVIAQQRDADRLTLWKFAVATDSLAESTRLWSWSLLDTYALYLKGQHPFCTTFLPVGRRGGARDSSALLKADGRAKSLTRGV
jgi:hypothetical protein